MELQARHRERQDTAGVILDAVSMLLQQHCLHTISIRDIARLAGVNSALISYYFHSKEELYQAVVARLFVAYEEEVINKIDLSGHPGESIRSACNLLVRFHRAYPCWLTLYFRELTNPSKSYEAIIRPSMGHASRQLTAMFKNAKDKGCLRKDVNPSFAALTLVSMINYCFMTMKAMQHDEQFNMDVSLEAYVEHVIEALKGLTTPLAVNS